MATTKAKTEEAAVVETEEREDVFIPRGGINEDPMFFVSVNCKNYLLPRGKTSSVPKEVAMEIKRAFLAQEIRNERMSRMASDY